MNFFSSIFSDDPEPSDPTKSTRPENDDIESESPSSPKPNPSMADDSSPQSSDASTWDFGGLFKTIANRSESVIGTYRRDLEEFRSGLIKETTVFRDVATRAVKEFPDSIDAGAAAAQERLETVGKTLDTIGTSVFKGTAEIIARSKELHLFDDDNDDEGSDINDAYVSGQSSDSKNLNLKKYSWFDARMNEIQCDPKTYTDDPDDVDDYNEWTTGFVLDDMGEEIMYLMGDNRVIERLYLELVPVTIDRETFWSRYYYRVYKLKQAEEARARIVKRAISGDDDEELSWDVDDDDINNDVEEKITVESKGSVENVAVESSSDDHKIVEARQEAVVKNEIVEEEVTESAVHDKAVEKTESETADGKSEPSADVQDSKLDEGKISEGKSDNGGSCKDSDVSIVSTQPSMPGEEDELGWDEIEDLGSDDDHHKTAATKSSDITDLRKRLSVAEDDEDLSWDIEDDDEPVKK